MTGRRTLSTVSLAVLLLTTTLATVAPGAKAGAGLVADAGSSRQTDGITETLKVDGEAFGGTQPYSFNWSIPALEQSWKRFGNASQAETRVDLSGLSGTVELNLTVTDAADNAAHDTVLYHVAPVVAHPVDQDVQFTFGVPDEIFGASGAVDQQTRRIDFQVPSGADVLFAKLTWQEGPPGLVVFNNDLDLVLVDPSGGEASGDQGRTAGHPETATVQDPASGSWTAEIEAWLTGPEDAHLEVVAFQKRQLPKARTPGPKTFGTLDDQTLHGVAKGPAGTTGAWDLDLDGVLETDAEDVTLDRAPGTYEVRYKATGPDGFEDVKRASFEVIGDADHAIPLHCGGRTHWTAPMEFSASGGTCWMHGGHHTYVLEDTVDVVGAKGWAFSVEQQFSPSHASSVEPGGLGADVQAPIHIEVSDDGQNWTSIENASYEIGDVLKDCFICLDLRQRVNFAFETAPTEAEFLRVHQPRSAAQGLSGFLDRTHIILFANETDTSEPSPATQDGQVALSCRDGDVLEDFFESHPCWFGGINRYDTPSFFHTYKPGRGTSVTALEATVQVAPWRTDDWFIPIPFPVEVSGVPSDPSADVEEEEIDAFAEQVSQTQVFVQTSPDGVSWETIGNETVLFGERETFQIDLEQPQNARFVRLIPDEHPRFDDFRADPPLHHPEAFFLFSELTLTGQLPSSGPPP